MSLPYTSRAEILKESLIFSSLGEDELAELAKLSIERNFKPEEFVFWEDETKLKLLSEGPPRV